MMCVKPLPSAWYDIAFSKGANYYLYDLFTKCLTSSSHLNSSLDLSDSSLRSFHISPDQFQDCLPPL